MEIRLRPEMRTDGGEMVTIYRDDEWVGDAYFVYREGDLLTGTIQLDSVMVNSADYSPIVEAARTYAEDLADALAVEEALVASTLGDVKTVLDVGTDGDDSTIVWVTEEERSLGAGEFAYTVEFKPDGSMQVERKNME